MEGKITPAGLAGLCIFLFPVVLHPLWAVHAQEQTVAASPEGAVQMQLRKSPLKTREYQGKVVEGEERVIQPGDSLWRILVQEKGLSERRFHRHVVIVQGLNPGLKKPDLIRVGDTIFIPLRADEILGIQLPAGKRGETRVYTVKKGEFLYKIIQEQLGAQQKQKVQTAFNQVKDLNPSKRNWNLLYPGEPILLPYQVPDLPPPEPGKTMDVVVGLDYGRKLPLQTNLNLLEQVMSAVGNETQRSGEEALPLREGTIHIDRDLFPVVQNPKSAKKVILDPEGRIPASLRTQLEKQASSTPIVPMKKGTSLHEAVTSLLSRMGFQSLPANRPVVIQDQGVAVQVKGEWMVTGPEDGSGKQEVFVISLTDAQGQTPAYLKDYLSFKGMSLKEIFLPPVSMPAVRPVSLPVQNRSPEVEIQTESWPADKDAMVDAVLGTYQVTAAIGQQLSVVLREGLRMDTKADRLFEIGGKKIAMFFRQVPDEVKKALQERDGVSVVELNLQSLSSRDLISRLLDAMGERTLYQEHRFPAIEGGPKDKLVISVGGFYLPDRARFLTDREIPKDLYRFFAEKQLRIVYFR